MVLGAPVEAVAAAVAVVVAAARSAVVLSAVVATAAVAVAVSVAVLAVAVSVVVLAVAVLVVVVAVVVVAVVVAVIVVLTGCTPGLVAVVVVPDVACLGSVWYVYLNVCMDAYVFTYARLCLWMAKVQRNIALPDLT